MKPSFAIAVAGGVVLVGLVSLWSATRPVRPVTSGGSVPIEVEGNDPLLDQLGGSGAAVPGSVPPPSSDFGGSAVQQSPSFDQDTWRTLMDGEIR